MDELLYMQQNGYFENIIGEIRNIKSAHPEYSEDRILEIMNQNHPKSSTFGMESAMGEYLESLTDSEKKLYIHYPLDALKVNTAKSIAISQTETKFGFNGFGDKNAFRHGIWNVEMTVLIGKEKAKLFAIAHEDKDVTGNESDGYSKEAHRDMDLHNNEVGRTIGETNSGRSEDEMADIIYLDIYYVETQFIWLHE